MHINIIYIYTCRDNISECSEVDLRGGTIYMYIQLSIFVTITGGACRAVTYKCPFRVLFFFISRELDHF